MRFVKKMQTLQLTRELQILLRGLWIFSPNLCLNYWFSTYLKKVKTHSIFAILEKIKRASLSHVLHHMKNHIIAWIQRTQTLRGGARWFRRENLFRSYQLYRSLWTFRQLLAEKFWPGVDSEIFGGLPQNPHPKNRIFYFTI